ncbi:MAG: DNA mismatch repair protein MutL, partial [Prevotellaceae bacterium]|nr:DNA mismatch repair protein MutL [Prevotellaceae bacterium]
TEATYKVATAEHVREHLQYKGHYLLTSVKSGLMLIDQHRAHVRILFDCYMEQIAGRKGVSQGLLFPEVLQLTAAEALVLPEILSGLVALGFDLNDLGGSSYAVQGIPAGLEGLRPVELLRDMIHAAMEKGKDFKEPLQHRLALTLAHAAAIPYGQVLGDEEISRLINRLFASSMPNYTPDGQLILITLKDEELDRHFRAK